tara:strand:+ start:2599 stop:3492 length:894 start_codon:yes stop_codon:yes gene_type:complete
MKIKSILVTGGSGFLGSHVCDELIRRGYQVTNYDKKKSEWAHNTKKYKMIVGDINNFKLLDKQVKRNDIIFHFAGLANLDEAIKKPLETVKYNIFSTVKLLALANKYKIERFIYASSIYANSSDGGFYSLSKRAAENYIQEYFNHYRLGFTIMRYGSLYGPRSGKDNGIKRIIDNAIKNRQVSYGGNKKTVRKYIEVHEAAKLTADMIKKKYENKYISIVGKKKIKVQKLLEIVRDKLGIKKKIIYKKDKLFGHYTQSLKKYQSQIDKQYFSKKNYNFKSKVAKLIDYELNKNKLCS